MVAKVTARLPICNSIGYNNTREMSLYQPMKFKFCSQQTNKDEWQSPYSTFRELSVADAAFP